MDYLCQSILDFTQCHGTKNIVPTSFVQIAIPKNALIILEIIFVHLDVIAMNTFI